MLFNIVQRKQVSVADTLSGTSVNISFRRSLTGNKWDKWLHLVNRLMYINLTNTQDEFVWGLTSSGLFTVKSIYVDLLNRHTQYLRKYIWKMKVPLKIKIFHVVPSPKAGHSNQR